MTARPSDERDRIRHVEAWALSLPRDEPYLGPMESGIPVTAAGLFVRPGNRSIYSEHDHCVLVRIETADGLTGWGEAVAVVAPKVVTTVIADILADQLIGRAATDVQTLTDDLYQLMRVRGFSSGFYVDALAAVDIALWDLLGKRTGLPVGTLLGGIRRTRIPVYASGLPAPTLDARVALARSFQDRGFVALKFAAAVSHDGIVTEIAALREALGPAMQIFCDMHWKYSAAEAIALIRRMEAHRLDLAEAPVHPEDIEGLAAVAAAVDTPLGAGEEWRTPYEFLPRLQRGVPDVLQPELGRCGLTFMQRIGTLAQAWHRRLMPHASIGIGIFQAASLHFAATRDDLPFHEYQHSIFDRNLAYVETTMRCADGCFVLPEGPGLGITPREEVFRHAI